MKTIISAAFAAATLCAGMASAATLSGTFDVTVVNVTNLNSAQSQATLANYNAALAGTLGDGNEVFNFDTFTYTGALDFETRNGNATTIAGWLTSKGVTLPADLDATVGGLQQSKSNINDGSATTTFYLFDLVSPLGAADFTVVHDDGIAIFDGGVLVGDRVGPTAVKTTKVTGFDGGDFELLYVATNNDPSILNVDVSPIPLPAGLPLLAVGLGGLVALRRRRDRA
jgi:hypothetical protein